MCFNQAHCYTRLAIIFVTFYCRRVHISEATRKALGDQFTLEHGNGQERDDYLKEKDIVTWLVDVPEVLCTGSVCTYCVCDIIT